MKPKTALRRAKVNLYLALKTLEEGNPRVHPFEERIKHEINNLEAILSIYEETY